MRRTRVLIVVGFVLGIALTGVVLAITGTSPVSDGVTYQSPSNTTVELTGSTEVQHEDLFPQSDVVQLRTEAGVITFSSSSRTDATIAAANIEGTQTSVTNLDVTGADLTIDPQDKPEITVGGQMDSVDFTAMTLDDNSVDFEYSSSGTASITVNGLQSNTQVRAIDPNQNEFIGGGTTDNTGSVTFSNMPSGTYDVEINSFTPSPPSLSNLQDDGSTRFANQTLSVDVSDSDYPFENVTLSWYVDGNLENTTYADSAGTYSANVGPFSDGDHDYYVEATDTYGETTTSNTQTFTINHYNPQTANIKPAGDLNAEPSQVSVDVSDADFANDGDELDVTIDVDGSQVTSQTIQSNGTVSTSLPSSAKTGGSHSITVKVTDDYGQTTTATQTYRVPDDLFIRSELNHSKLVPADGEVRFFTSQQVFSRSAPDGTVNLTGLPVDEPMIVDVEPTNQNFTDRTTYLDSIYQQESVYVLNTSAVSTISARFVLNDPTGRYDSNSRLRIQKAINVSGNLSYQNIIIDEFGAEGVTATLEQSQRYRLVVADDNSGTQVIGPYRGEVSETIEVVPGEAEVRLENATQGFRVGAAISNTTIEYRYSDPDNSTSLLKLFIHERGNKSNLAQPNQTFTDLGSISGQATVPNSQKDREWVVEYIITRDGETFVHTVPLSNRNNLVPPLAQGWQSMIGVGMLVLLAGAFSVLNAGIGAVIVSLVGGVLWFIGFLGAATSGIAVALAIFISVIGHSLSGRR